MRSNMDELSDLVINRTGINLFGQWLKHFERSVDIRALFPVERVDAPDSRMNYISCSRFSGVSTEGDSVHDAMSSLSHVSLTEHGYFSPEKEVNNI